MNRVEVILITHLPNLGKIGDTVQVSAGYARNYLLPNGKALRASETNLKLFAEKKAELEQENATLFQRAQSLLETINSKEVTIEAQSDGDGKLYGAVSVKEIINKLSTIGLGSFKTEQVKIVNGKIKEVGLHDICIELHPQVQAKLIINVMRSS